MNKMTSLSCILLAAVLLANVGVRVVAEEKQKDADFECIQCVENIHPGCGDEFDIKKYNETNKYRVKCVDHRPHIADGEDREAYQYKHAVGCRKILQEIDDKTHVVRQCAFSGENVDGLKRTGNKGVRLYYYQCSDKPLCNGAYGKWRPSAIGLTVVLMCNLFIKLLI